MFEILRKSLRTGVVTTLYPQSAPDVSSQTRGRPEIDFPNWKDARPATNVCPTGAIAFEDQSGIRTATLDLAKCIFCGLCAEADAAIRITPACELASTHRDKLKFTARYRVKPDGAHQQLLEGPALDHEHPAHSGSLLPSDGRGVRGGGGTDGTSGGVLDVVGEKLKNQIHNVLGRSLHIREVDAGSCNGCEVEIVGLNSPVYDVERFGIHFVASPRHADMLLVTGPVTRNMELALQKTYDAMPAPRLVVAVGACGCSGGIFGQNYASLSGVDQVLPVDVYIPGCPPNPHALLHGILVAVGRMQQRVNRGGPQSLS